MADRKQVERAARVAFAAFQHDVAVDGRAAWESIPEDMRITFRMVADAVLMLAAAPAPAARPAPDEGLRAEALEALRAVVKPCRVLPLNWYSCRGDDDPTKGYTCSDDQCHNPNHDGRRACDNPWHSLSPALRAALTAPDRAEQEDGA